MRTYQHSVSFGVLKRIRESIPENYTSQQYAEVLDGILYAAVEPLVCNTDVFRLWVPRVLAWYNSQPRNRKISSLEREQLQAKACLFLLVPQEERLCLLRSMKMERNIITFIVEDFLTLTADYRSTMEKTFRAKARDRPSLLLELERIDQAVGVHGIDDLYALFQHVRVWYALYLEFRGYLIEKFTRYAIMKAKENYVKVNYALDLDDIIQHYLLAVGKAIDKCDTDEGPLASYVGQWFLNARTTVRKEIGNLQTESYEALEGEEFDFGEHTDVESGLEKIQTIERVRRLALIADPLGFGRLALEIDECQLKPDEFAPFHHNSVE